MAVTRALLVLAPLLLSASAAVAQPITTEVDLTAGISSQDTTGGAAQIRVFGRTVGEMQFFVEGALAAEGGHESDAFSSAYPYDRGVYLMEAYGERLFQTGRLVAGVRGGRYRTPFGIYNRGDHAYTGFLRAPLVRYDGYFALSNNYLEHGAAAFIGTSHLVVESSIGAPSDVGGVHRRAGVDVVVRAQGYAGPFIVGVSRIWTQPYQPETFAHGRAAFTGVDGRWMAGGVQLRGEWLFGRPFDGTSTDGGYFDVSVHRPEMRVVTVVFRLERINYDTVPQFAMYARRETAGARIRLGRGVSAEIDAVHQTDRVAYGHPWAIDVGLTYSIRH
jgi:hypothetical protein